MAISTEEACRAILFDRMYEAPLDSHSDTMYELIMKGLWETIMRFVVDPSDKYVCLDPYIHLLGICGDTKEQKRRVILRLIENNCRHIYRQLRSLCVGKDTISTNTGQTIELHNRLKDLASGEEIDPEEECIFISARDCQVLVMGLDTIPGVTISKIIIDTFTNPTGDIRRVNSGHANRLIKNMKAIQDELRQGKKESKLLKCLKEERLELHQIRALYHCAPEEAEKRAMDIMNIEFEKMNNM